MISARIVPRIREISDGFNVRRALPSSAIRSVGPFVFFDAFGPTVLRPGTGLDVRPHPHIGLATVTYLLEGEILHRDSLGTEAPIRPGEVNWMTAGRGIVHSERTPAALRLQGSTVYGLQTWVALPLAHEEDPPSFVHHATLPMLDAAGLSMRVILGRFADVASPVATVSETFYADATLDAGARLDWAGDIAERALYVVEGSLVVGDAQVEAGTMLVFEPGLPLAVDASTAARVMLLGGEPLDAPRFVWWNFVSSRKERIREAAEDWKAQRFPAVPGETEFIPLPERAPGVVDYP
jgi:redox-sensitive bicupin YhaK (pirin superfamily)